MRAHFVLYFLMLAAIIIMAWFIMDEIFSPAHKVQIIIVQETWHHPIK